MKRKASFLLATILLCCLNTWSQPKPATPKSAEKAPTQKEMEALMKEAENTLKNLTPEEKKMMEQMGIKMPNLSEVPKVSDKQLADAWEDETRVVPKKKTALIEALPKSILTTAELQSLIRKTNASIATLMDPKAKQVTDQLNDQFKNDPYYGYLIAATANGMWMMNYKESATYLMGKAVEAIPNADHLNNFASYLTMGGAAHIAIPMLEKLNSIHKRNSTVLNNLGQAWLQLGDEQKAERYLDSAIQVYPYHPQANYTQCLLLNAKGKKQEAIAALQRSLKHSVSPTKLRMLKELEGDKHKAPPLYARRVYFSNSFNLHKYAAMVPKNYATAVGKNVELEWKAFRAYIQSELDQVTQQMEKVSVEAKDAEMAFFKRAQSQRFDIHSPFYDKAVERYNQYMVGYKRHEEQFQERMTLFNKQKVEAKIQFDQAYAKERERFSQEILQGANKQENCAGKLPIINAFLEKTNQINQKANEEALSFWMTESYNQYYYYPSTANTDASALLYVLALRGGFLGALLNLTHESDLNYPCMSDIKGETPYSKLKPLDDYDEVNCKIFNWIYSPGLGNIVMRCNTMSVHINPIFLPFDASMRAHLDGFVEQASISVEVKGVTIKAAAEFDEQGNLEKASGGLETEIVKDVNVSLSGEATFDEKGYKKGSVELELENKLKLMPKSLEEEAPVDIGMKNKLGVGMELSRDDEGNLISDFVVKDKTDLNFGAKIEVDQSVEITPGMISKSGKVTEPEKVKLGIPAAPSVKLSADNRWSVNSGYSGKASSSFTKIK